MNYDFKWHGGDNRGGESSYKEFRKQDMAVSEGVEARRSNPGWSPADPTDEERREHESSGAPWRRT
jgi:hypothetical protein